MTRTVAVVGTGADPENPTRHGFAMGYKHAEAYGSTDGAELVACADLVRENADAFAERYDLEEEAVFEDHERLLETVDPDIVSVTVPPVAHTGITLDAIGHGVEAVFCEKPMALTFGDARRMADAADEAGVELAFNHQRRFAQPVRIAKQLLDDGTIGDLRRVEFSAGNLYDYGSHSFDLCNYFNDETRATWVLAGLDYREENVFFGAHNENQAIVQWEYENGVQGLACTGYGGNVVGSHNRIVGSEGVIEVGPNDAEPSLRVRRDGEGWESIDTDGEGLHEGETFIARAVESVLEATETGTPSELGATNALNATELIFGAWESARRRGRIELPLAVEDNPLEAMVEDGTLAPSPVE